MDMKKFYRVSKHTRYRELSDSQYLIEKVGDLICFQVSYPIIEIIESIRDQKLIDLQDIKISYDIPENELTKIAERLINKGIILEPGKDERYLHSTLDPNFWCKDATSFTAATDYHFTTFNYPFYDYGVGGEGYKIQLENMFKYSKQKEDNDRYKTCERNDNIDVISLKSLEEINIDKKNNDIEAAIYDSIAMSFSVKSLKKVPWSNHELLRTTSPTGGGRQPIEGYWFNQDGQCYHISRKENSLIPINYKNSKYSNSILLTCIFERNSFRYREPRTFRTVHMDAGHITSTLDICLSKHNIQLEHITKVDYEEILTEMDINPSIEFPMFMFKLIKQGKMSC